MKLSIIIPVYNVKPYLRQCVDSVLAQTYQDLEIILVDDGSTDGSGQLADEICSSPNSLMAFSPPRLKCIHKSNGGLSDARNAGLKVATGDYVLFLDSDDYYADSYVLETLVNTLSKWDYPDALLFCRNDYYENLQVMHPESPYDETLLNNMDTPLESFAALLDAQRFNMSACFQILKRSVLVDNNIQFVVGLRNEDIDWSMHLWQHLRSVKVINLYAYIYRHRDNSITTTMCLRDYQSYDYMFDKWKKLLSAANSNELLYLQYLAYIYPTMVYGYLSLKRPERKDAYAILLRHSDILQYASTRKSMRVERLKRMFGLRLAITLLSIYAVYFKPIIRQIRK